ncbi:hypothetical protein E4T66_18410 [Sinimarinibacterium sp. CAU 1509]|uniref:hypothetical protein n=1 Tax=Sinimarinibacterium sp. CAU 1509 TaxID=2562283 RepID=UPI0010AD38C9|nr:hypothetical protein [Sinimarinibacterium sp. CAU 1509]TJY57380.1 hypothetical protein E4T66_18410 [Sinimarinibacterium sp. CAU 1509]
MTSPTTAARLIERLVAQGREVKEVAAECRLTVAQLRRLRTGSQPAASEDAVLVLAGLAGCTPENTAELVLENALERIGAEAKTAFLERARSGTQQSSAYCDRVVLDEVAACPQAEVVARLLAAVESRGAMKIHPRGVWVKRPDCLYVAIEGGANDGDTIVETQASGGVFGVGERYVVATEVGHLTLMTFLAQIPGTHQLAFATTTDPRQTIRVVATTATPIEAGGRDLFLVGRATRVVHQDL